MWDVGWRTGLRPVPHLITPVHPWTVHPCTRAAAPRPSALCALCAPGP